MKKVFLLNIICFLLVACGSNVEGTYTDPIGLLVYRFESHGRVYLSKFGVETEMRYEVNGNKVTVKSQALPTGNLVLTLLRDGNLQGPFDLKLVRKHRSS